MSRDYVLRSFRAPINPQIDYARELNPQQCAAVTAPPVEEPEVVPFQPAAQPAQRPTQGAASPARRDLSSVDVESSWLNSQIITPPSLFFRANSALRRKDSESS